MSELSLASFELDESSDINILALALTRGLFLRSDCGGKGLCGKCRITVDEPQNLSAVTEAERKALTADDLTAGFRLACQTVARGKVTVSVPASSLETREASGKNDLVGRFPVDPMVKRLLVDPKPKLTSDYQDILTILRKMAPGLNDEECENPLFLRELSAHWDEKTGITLIKHRKKSITGVLAGARRTSLDFAVDVGTTTVAAYLCDLSSGNVLGASSCSNPQRRYGEDVISRIAFAGQSEDGTRTLQRLIVEEINSLFGECLRNAGVNSRKVDDYWLTPPLPKLRKLFSFYP